MFLASDPDIAEGVTAAELQQLFRDIVHLDTVSRAASRARWRSGRRAEDWIERCLAIRTDKLERGESDPARG
jgi:hypothetical protein